MMLPVQQAVKNWTPRLPMTAPSLVGHHVRTDPLDLDKDIPLLWDALGGNDGTINERLKWYGFADYENPQDFCNVLQRFHQPETGCCVNVFRLHPSNQVAGMASYMATRPEHGTTEVGLVAHGPAMVQTPAATEAHYLLAKHAFEELGYRRYEWKCDALNAPSNKAALRYGFTFEGCFRQHVVTAKGFNRDTNWYSMLDSEWPQRKKAMEAWLDPSNFDPNGKQKHRLQHFQEWKNKEQPKEP